MLLPTRLAIINAGWMRRLGFGVITVIGHAILEKLAGKFMASLQIGKTTNWKRGLLV